MLPSFVESFTKRYGDVKEESTKCDIKMESSFRRHFLITAITAVSVAQDEAVLLSRGGNTKVPAATPLAQQALRSSK